MEPWNKFTLVDLLYNTEVRNGDSIAVIDNDNRLSYTQLCNKVKGLASYFHMEGIKKGDKVVLQLHNSALFEIVVFALFDVGAVPILTLPAHREHVIDSICAFSQPVGYITMNNYYGVNFEEKGRRIFDKYKCITKFYTEDDLNNILDTVCLELSEYERPLPTDIAFLSLSGGTTGVPKLIPRTHGDYSYNAILTAVHCGISPKTKNLSAIPVAHNFAFGTPGMVGTVYAGGTNIMCDYPSPAEIFDWIERERVTIMSLVPTVVNICIQYRQVDDGNDISTLEYLLVGGSVFPPKLAELAEKSFETKIIQVYGMSEGMTFLTDRNADKNIRYYTQGKPCSKKDVFFIVDKDFNVLPDGEEGEVIVKGPYTIKHYFGDLKENEMCFKNGFYRPGDKGIKHSSGNIVITGRVKEQINRAGEKIMPSEVEKYFINLPSVHECAAIGISDSVLGESICMFYIGDTFLSYKDVVHSFRKSNIEDDFIPDKIVRINEWPLTAVGKIDRNALKGLLTDAGE